MQLRVLLTALLFGLPLGCLATAPGHSQKKPAALVVDVGDFSERYDLPLQRLAEAVHVHPNTRLFRVTGILMFGGWQSFTFWYDRQRQRLRYRYADGGETYTGDKQSVWAGVTERDLGELAKQTENVTTESFFKTLPQLGCQQVYFHRHEP